MSMYFRLTIIVKNSIYNMLSHLCFEVFFLLDGTNYSYRIITFYHLLPQTYQPLCSSLLTLSKPMFHADSSLNYLLVSWVWKPISFLCDLDWFKWCKITTQPNSSIFCPQQRRKCLENLYIDWPRCRDSDIKVSQGLELRILWDVCGGYEEVVDVLPFERGWKGEASSALEIEWSETLEIFSLYQIKGEKIRMRVHKLGLHHGVFMGTW